MSNKILVTGSAGFIGFHLCKKLCANGFEVTGIDNLNNYYDPRLKEARLENLKELKDFSFKKVDLSDQSAITSLFNSEKFSYIINLAAQAGVRYSLSNPYAYIKSNIDGFLNILENCKNISISHLIYASSSSVYGANVQMPFSVHQNVDHPLSLYAATKKANELMAHTYSSLYNLPTTGLRFFTVYGPWGRPDMAAFIFTKAILEGKPIDVYNFGKMERDFTYVDDIVEAISRLVNKIPEPNKDWYRNQPDPGSSFAPYKLYNIGNHQPVQLTKFIEILEKNLNKTAIKNFLPLQPGDVTATYADVEDLYRQIDFKPVTSIEEGLSKFINWYKEYYKV